ncbi:KRAB-A domain-containing protein 2-like [Colias croceus]|uniref:KRAB-A domain-containing protein 2-like n=1 Tax=Colias crocea TaxID=72248 RepID=UPI001E27FB2D|nr:KRAB-A domain-containing protein 2-like [Colias croceus]
MSTKGNVTREVFDTHFNELLKSKTALNTVQLTKAKYLRIIEQVKEAHSKTRKTAMDYRRIKRYKVLPTPYGEKLFHNGGNLSQMFVTLDEVYDIIHEYHLKLNHCGKNRLVSAIKQKYRNVTAEFIILYLKLCKGCKTKAQKNTMKSKSNNTTADTAAAEILCEVGSSHQMPIDNLIDIHFQDVAEDTDAQENVFDEEIKTYPEQFSRGQIDILNVTTVPHEAYKYLMVYRNLVTKFIHLKPLTSTSVEESADALLSIFLVFGAPNVLQSRNGLSVSKHICKKISGICPEIKVVYGKPQKNGVKGHSNKDILKLLRDFLKQHTTMKWHQAIKFVQNSLNTSFDMSICRTPSEATFGSNPKAGLLAILTQNDCDNNLQSEDDLVRMLGEKDAGNVSNQIMLQESLIPASSIIKIENMDGDDDDDGDIFYSNLNF